MQLGIDQKVTLKIDNEDTEWVLLKHGIPATMAVDYQSLRELYPSFSDQCERHVVATPKRGASWNYNATGTPTPNKKIFWYSLPRKKVSFSYGNLRISQITNFKNRSFSLGQKVVQINPNSVCSIPCVPRV